MMRSRFIWSRWKKFVISGVSVTMISIASAFAMLVSMCGEREAVLQIWQHSTPFLLAAEILRNERYSLKLMTLNIAHGRMDTPTQILQTEETVKENLDEISGVIRREGPDMVALQEADGPSFWSGQVNHVGYLAENAGYPFSVRGEHVKGINLSYGTALLSMLPLKEPLSITFDPSPPTLSKGFVLATIPWPGHPNAYLDVVSVHLDFSRKSVRQRQVQDMINKLSPRNNPIIIMGDFNCEWTTKGSAVRTLAEELNLRGYQPHSEAMNTYPLLKKRLDWILISPELEFVEYKVLADTLSDHLGVICEVKKRG